MKTIILLFSMALSALADDDLVIEITSREADVQINAALLESSLTPDQIGALSAYFKRTDNLRGPASDIQKQTELNELLHLFETHGKTANSPQGYTGMQDAAEIPIGYGKMAISAAREIPLFNKQGLAVAEVGLEMMGHNAGAVDRHIGPDMQNIAQWERYAVEQQRREIALKVATKGKDDEKFARLFALSGLESKTGVNLGASGIENRKSNRNRLVGERMEKVDQILTAAYDKNGKGFRVPAHILRGAIKAETDAISEKVAKKIADIRKKEIEDQEKIQIDYQAYNSSLTLVTRIIATKDKKGADALAASGKAVLLLGMAVDGYKRTVSLGKSTAGALNLAAGIVGIVDGLMSAILGGPNIHQMILDEIRALRADIAALREEMKEGFAKIDERLIGILDRAELCFALLDRDVKDIKTDLNEIERAVADLDHYARELDMSLMLTLHDGFMMPVEEEIARCLQMPLAAVDFKVYSECLINMKTYATRHAQNNVSTPNRPKAFEDAFSLEDVYSTASTNLEGNLWRDINMLACLNYKRTKSSLPQLASDPLPNGEDFARYGQVLVTFLQRFPAFTAHLASDNAASGPLSILNDVLEKGEQIKQGIEQFGRSPALFQAVEDHKALLINLQRGLEEAKNRFESEHGFLSLELPLRNQPEVPLRPETPTGESFAKKNQAAISSTNPEYGPLGEFKKLHPCPELAAGKLQDDSRDMPAFILPANIGKFIPNVYRLGVQLGLGQLYVCYHKLGYVDVETRRSNPIEVPIHDNFWGRVTFGFTVYYRQGNTATAISRQEYIADKKDMTLFRSQVYKTVRLEGKPVIEGDGSNGGYVNQFTEGEKSRITKTAERLWLSILEKNQLDTGENTLPAKHAESSLEKVTRDVTSELQSKREAFVSNLSQWTKGGSENNFSRACRALTGSIKAIREYVQMALPQTLYSHDELYKLVIADNEGSLLSPAALRGWLKDTKRLFPDDDSKEPWRLTRLLQEQHQRADDLKALLVLGVATDKGRVQPGKEVHPNLEKSLVSLQLMKQKLELTKSSRIDFSVAVSRLRQVLAEFAN